MTKKIGPALEGATKIVPWNPKNGTKFEVFEKKVEPEAILA